MHNKIISQFKFKKLVIFLLKKPLHSFFILPLEAAWSCREKRRSSDCYAALPLRNLLLKLKKKKRDLCIKIKNKYRVYIENINIGRTLKKPRSIVRGSACCEILKYPASALNFTCAPWSDPLLACAVLCEMLPVSQQSALHPTNYQTFHSLYRQSQPYVWPPKTSSTRSSHPTLPIRRSRCPPSALSAVSAFLSPRGQTYKTHPGKMGPQRRAWTSKWSRCACFQSFLDDEFTKTYIAPIELKNYEYW